MCFEPFVYMLMFVLFFHVIGVWATWGSEVTCRGALPYLRWLVSNLLLWRPGYDPRLVCVGYVVVKQH